MASLSNEDINSTILIVGGERNFHADLRKSGMPVEYIVRNAQRVMEYLRLTN